MFSKLFVRTVFLGPGLLSLPEPSLTVPFLDLRPFFFFFQVASQGRESFLELHTQRNPSLVKKEILKMNGEAGPLKADLSTFNIEILQISKRIAPKSGLRWPAPHSPPDSPARPPKSLISFGLAAGGPLRLPEQTEERVHFSHSWGRDLGLVPFSRARRCFPAGCLPGLGSTGHPSRPSLPSPRRGL